MPTGGDDQVLEVPTEDNAASIDVEKIPTSNTENTTSPILHTDYNCLEDFSINSEFENENDIMERGYSDDAFHAGTLRDNNLRHNLSRNMLDLTNIDDEVDSRNNDENYFELRLERNDISDDDLSLLKSFSLDNWKEKENEISSSDEEDQIDSYVNYIDNENDNFLISEQDNESGSFFDKNNILDTICENSESEEEEESLKEWLPLSRQKAKLSTGISNLSSILESQSADPNPSFQDDTYDIKTQF